MFDWGMRWKGDVSGQCADDRSFAWHGIVVDDWDSVVDACFDDRGWRSVDQRYLEDGFEEAKFLGSFEPT